MKTFVKLLTVMLLGLTGCSTAFQTTQTYDDIYFSPTAAAAMAETAHQGNVTAVQVQPANAGKPAAAQYHDDDYGYSDTEVPYNNNYQYQGAAASETYYDDQGNTIITNNYYFDGQYDYVYASRIRRFHHPFVSMGYYDPYFTNLYWYNHDPFYYGVSIYMGYGAAGFYYPDYYDWYFYRLGYRPWGWTHYGFGWGWGPRWGSYWHGNHFGYWAGYHHGYWAGYHHGYWGGHYYQYIYNSLDASNYYYGPRTPSGSTTAQGSRPVSGRHNEPTFAQIYENSGQRQSAREAVASGGGRTAGEQRTATQRSDQRLALPASAGSDGRIGQAGNREASPSQNTTSHGASVSEQETVSGRENVSPAELSASSQQAERDQRTAQQPARTQQPVQQTERSTGDQARPAQTTPERYQPERRPSDYVAPSREQYNRQQQAPRYERPTQANPERTNPATEANPNTARPRTYTSPSQQQPRSNQEYRRPASEQARPATAAPENRQPQQTRPEATPQRPVQRQPQMSPQRPAQGQPQAAPQRAPEQSRPQASPAQSQPSRQQAAPSSSGRSSSPAVSSPSRSGGSSGGSSSGSSSSSGGRSGGERR